MYHGQIVYEGKGTFHVVNCQGCTRTTIPTRDFMSRLRDQDVDSMDHGNVIVYLSSFFFKRRVVVSSDFIGSVIFQREAD